MKNVKAICGTAVVTALVALGLLGTGSHVAAADKAEKMDCSAMFKKAEGMLSENKALTAEKKAALYEMAIKAFNMCKKSEAEMKGASDLFNQVFSTSGKM